MFFRIEAKMLSFLTHLKKLQNRFRKSRIFNRTKSRKERFFLYRSRMLDLDVGLYFIQKTVSLMPSHPHL